MHTVPARVLLVACVLGALVSLATAAAAKPATGCGTLLPALILDSARDRALYNQFAPDMQMMLAGVTYNRSASVAAFDSFFEAYDAVNVLPTAVTQLGPEGFDCLAAVDVALVAKDSGAYSYASYLVGMRVDAAGNITSWDEFDPNPDAPPTPPTVGAFFKAWADLDPAALGKVVADDILVIQDSNQFESKTAYLAFATQVMDMFAVYGLHPATVTVSYSGWVTATVQAYGTGKGSDPNAFAVTALAAFHINDDALIDILAVGNVAPFGSVIEPKH